MSIARVSDDATISRARLLHRLDHAVTVPLVLVVAPPGYGKSTLVAHWADQQDHPVAWVSLSAAVNSMAALTAAVARAVGAGIDPSPSLDALLDHVRATAAAGSPWTIVLDDYHLIENGDVHDAMDGLIAHLPDGVCLVLISRTQPPLALARLRSLGKVDALTEQDLRFTSEEIATVIDLLAPQVLTPEQVADLGQRTDGWIAGIRLALASLQHVNPDQVPSLLDTVTTQQWLDEYIVEEVLRRLPADLQAFVLHTAILDRLDPDLCNAMLGIEHGAALIQEVAKQLPFLRPSGPANPTMAYHPLFATSVQRIAVRREPPSARSDRHQRAAAWYAANGQVEAAIDHAVAAEAWAQAAEYLEILCRPMVECDYHVSRLYWLRKLPEAVLLNHPRLTYWYLTALQNTGNLQEARRLFQRVEADWTTSSDPCLLAMATAYRRFGASLDGEQDEALRLAYESLARFPLEEPVERLHAWTSVIQAEFMRGNDAVVEQAYRQAEACRNRLPAEQRWWTVVVALDRANQQALRGNLQAARELYQYSLDHLPGALTHQDGRFRFRLAAILLEHNDLEAAQAHAQSLVHDIRVLPFQIWHPEALLVVAQVQEAAGDLVAAEETLHWVREFYHRHGGRHNLHRLEAQEVGLWLATGRLGLIEDWVARAWVDDDAGVRIFGDADRRLARVRALLALGHAQDAAQILDRLIARASATRRWAELVPLLVWNAVIHRHLGDAAAAARLLAAAVGRGMPGGFVRSFLTPGHDLTPLLGPVRRLLDDDGQSYLPALFGERLPFAAATPADSPHNEHDDAPAPLPVALTAREHDILALVEQGLTNKEIGERLFISHRTVQKHVIRILRKTGAPTRTAVAAWYRRSAQRT